MPYFHRCCIKKTLFLKYKPVAGLARYAKTIIMALIKLSSIGITNLSGKAGGSVFSHNRGGKYVRNFAVPSNPQTTAQMQARSDFGAFASAWRSLTQEQRNAWIEAAPSFPYVDRFGDQKVMSGENLYISLNRNLEIAGGDVLTSPPVPEGATGLIITDLTTSINAGTFVFDATLNAAGEQTEATSVAVYATPPISPGISYAKNRVRFVQLAPDFFSGDSIDLATKYQAVFGTPPEGSKIIIRFSSINPRTGERAATVQGFSIVEDVTP